MASAPAIVRVEVPKAYKTRLPVSGKEPPRMTKYERQKIERRNKT